MTLQELLTALDGVPATALVEIVVRADNDDEYDTDEVVEIGSISYDAETNTVTLREG